MSDDRLDLLQPGLGYAVRRDQPPNAAVGQRRADGGVELGAGDPFRAGLIVVKPLDERVEPVVGVGAVLARHLPVRRARLTDRIANAGEYLATSAHDSRRFAPGAPAA